MASHQQLLGRARYGGQTLTLSPQSYLEPQGARRGRGYGGHVPHAAPPILIEPMVDHEHEEVEMLLESHLQEVARRSLSSRCSHTASRAPSSSSFRLDSAPQSAA